jgi:nucleoside-diphosphate-sugar epimerase
MKAAIFGAAGFLGQVLCRQLQAAGWEVLAYDAVAPGAAGDWSIFRPTGEIVMDDPVRKHGPVPLPPLSRTGVHFILHDVLRDEIALPCGIEAVYYLAQSPHYREFPEAVDHLFGVNTYGAIKAARAACAAGAGLFCYTSTGNVYQPSLQPLDESSPVRRDDPYALSKLAAEEALQLLTAHLPVVSVRLFGLFGPGQQKMLPVTLLRKLRAGEPIVLEPAGDWSIFRPTGEVCTDDSVRKHGPVPFSPAQSDADEPEGLTISFSYVEDTARCLMELAAHARAGGVLPAVLNVAGAEPISLRRFAVTLGGILGIEPRFERAPTCRSFNLIADVARLQTLLHPVFVPFAAAMQRSYGRGCGRPNVEKTAAPP